LLTFFSSLLVLRYYMALKKGLKVLVKASLTGTLLATMLFLPGLFMVLGGMKYDEQVFNLRSAGVSSSLLFVSVAGAYVTPHTLNGNGACAHIMGQSFCLPNSFSL
jgi:calcium/proton exchanger cax